jgi:hypothetical protein
MLRKIDYFFNKLLPKKLIVWVIATILCFNKLLPPDLWAYISIIYLGANVVSKFPDNIFSNKKEH